MKTLREEIRDHPFFHGFSPDEIDRVCERATEESFAAGDVIFREGEPANRLFLVQSGRVALETRVPRDGLVAVGRVGEGEPLGWSWLFPPFSWHFQARALAPTTVVTLDGGQLLVMAETDPKFGRDLMKRVSQVVVKRLQSARDELVRQHLEPPLAG